METSKQEIPELSFSDKEQGLQGNTYLIWMISSVCITFLVLMIQLGSFDQAWAFVNDHLGYFMVNGLIVSLLNSLMLWGKRPYFILCLNLFGWLFLSLGNVILLKVRGLPLMFSDFFLIKEGLSLAGNYLTPQLITATLFSVGACLLVLLISLRFKTKPVIQGKTNGLLIAVLGVFLLIQLNKAHYMEPIGFDYASSYTTYGFPYSLLSSSYPYFEGAPEGYGRTNVKRIMKPIDETLQDETDANVIIVQLESFVDLARLKNIEFSVDPLKNFHQLQKDYLSGDVRVQTFGGGTATTEFEVMTSMTMKSFTPGEIPYNSTLNTTAVESLATIFKEMGHHTAVIHNYKGNFYNRDKAFPNLGYDTYIPIEHMTNTQGPHFANWVNDAFLFDYIIKTLEKTEEKDYIYAISTGTHGPYEESVFHEDHEIQLKGNLGVKARNALQDYSIRMQRLDDQIQRLVDYLNTSDEKTVVLFFSDHLPKLSTVTDKTFYSDDLYLSPYVIYSNFELENVEPYDGMTTYQISSYLLNLLGINSGIMNQIHSTYATNEHYQEILLLIQYDLLKGKRFAFNGENPYEKAATQFGLNEIEIDKVWVQFEKLFVSGSGFNSDSVILLDGKAYETTFVDQHTLRVDEVSELNFETLEIKQQSDRNQFLGDSVVRDMNE